MLFHIIKARNNPKKQLLKCFQKHAEIICSILKQLLIFNPSAGKICFCLLFLLQTSENKDSADIVYFLWLEKSNQVPIALKFVKKLKQKQEKQQQQRLLIYRRQILINYKKYYFITSNYQA
eukprot:TRINITY_DN4376_c0_g1_i4.p3 TRINITY_DN4376_c0_g1~~TRINITY_DN4376_c0_g1_i4.p3  ORF type:complete len:121 (+),score=3.98 TRINITY_DN4376_c0_g1_i4:101-463(+)